MHEKLYSPVRTLLGDDNLEVFYYAWVIPGIITVIILALFFSLIFLHLPTKTRIRFFVASTLYIGGAIGIELIGGHYAELIGDQNLTYSMRAIIEECLEMAGLIVFIWALMKYFAEHYKEVQFRFNA